jgi:hypothetical protein
MFKRLVKVLTAAAIFASILLVRIGGPMVASATGMGPADAIVPTNQWTALSPGQQTWYAFNYAGDGSQILVRMGVDPSSAGAFEVWTPSEIQQWARGDDVKPIGRGSKNDAAFGGDLVWSGNFNTPGPYYVVVNQSGLTPANYSLQIGGNGVSFPKAALPASKASAQPAISAPAAASANADKPTVVSKSGTGPGDALAISGNWEPLGVGQQKWYAFTSEGDGFQVLVQMSVDKSDGASFAVWTPDEVMKSAQDSTVQPVGRGSKNDALGGDLAWTGTFNTPGTYYVVVTQTGPTAANYMLAINFSEAAPSGENAGDDDLGPDE